MKTLALVLLLLATVAMAAEPQPKPEPAYGPPAPPGFTTVPPAVGYDIGAKPADTWFPKGDIVIRMFALGQLDRPADGTISRTVYHGSKKKKSKASVIEVPTTLYDDLPGGGVGVDWYPGNEYLGIGTELAYLAGRGDGVEGAFRAAGSIVARYPIGRFAPYLRGGGGYDFGDYDHGFGFVRGGLEVRATRTLGVFTEGGHEWGRGDYPVILGGISFSL